MTRQDFIFTLFDNGDGLTLDQIAEIERELNNTLPSEIIEDLQESNGTTKDEALEIALSNARDVFMDEIGDCADLLALRQFINHKIGDPMMKVTDMQVFRLWYAGKKEA